MANLITGLFDTTASAENAVTQLKELGYAPGELTIIMRDIGSAEAFAADTGSHTMEGIGTGATIGGALGAVLAGLLAVGTVTIPGVGLLAAGPLAAMLAGAGAGGIAGSLIGWLVGAGIPDDLAPYYERGLNEGGVVVAVAAHSGDEERVREILRGEAVAYSGYNTPAYVSPAYAARRTITSAPTDIYGNVGSTDSVRSNAVGAPEAERRTTYGAAVEHEHESRRDGEGTRSGLDPSER